MKQVIVTAPFQYDVVETQIPKPQKGEVLVKMKAAGVCGSDFHLFLSENPQAVFPRVPGHENAGVITETGAGVTTVKPGDHVVVDLVIACGTCRQCRSGRRNICKTVKSRGTAADGGFREYLTVPEHEVFLLPEDMPFKDAALVEPFAIGGHCTKRARVQKDDVVLVYGTGTIGAIILQTCKSIGCQVICADINDSSLARARKYGADQEINSGEENLPERIKTITEDREVDVIFDGACYPGSLTYLMQPGMITNGGRIVPLGFSTGREEITQAMINGRELEIIGTRMSAGQFEPTIQKLYYGEYTLEGIVSDYIPFEEVGRVFENMKNPPGDLKKW